MGNDRTSEGLAPSGLEPDPVGKPDPEAMDPQLVEMVINQLRDGIRFPPEVRTLAEVITWTTEHFAVLTSEPSPTAEADIVSSVLEKLVQGTGLHRDTETLDDAITWIIAGFAELKRIRGTWQNLTESVSIMGQTPDTISPVAAELSTQESLLDTLKRELKLAADLDSPAAVFDLIRAHETERESLHQIESAAEATRLYAAVEGGSVPPKTPSTPYGEISGGPVSDMLSLLRESEKDNPDAHHSRDAAAVDDAHTQSFAEPTSTPADCVTWADTPVPITEPTPDTTGPAASELSTHLGNLLTRILGSMTSDLSKDMDNAYLRIDAWRSRARRKAPESKPTPYGIQPGSPPYSIPPKPTADHAPNPAAAMSTFVSDMLAQSDIDAPSSFDILAVCMEMAVFLMSKNKQYGDSALDPVRILSSADPVEQLRVRIDDKLSRMVRGQAAGEDTFKDLIGYGLLLRVAEKRAGG